MENNDTKVKEQESLEDIIKEITRAISKDLSLIRQELDNINLRVVKYDRIFESILRGEIDRMLRPSDIYAMPNSQSNLDYLKDRLNKSR